MKPVTGTPAAPVKTMAAEGVHRDNPAVALKICREVGLTAVFTGRDIASHDDANLASGPRKAVGVPQADVARSRKYRCLARAKWTHRYFPVYCINDFRRGEMSVGIPVTPVGTTSPTIGLSSSGCLMVLPDEWLPGAETFGNTAKHLNMTSHRNVFGYRAVRFHPLPADAR